jgi:hypothetical protein
MPTLVLVNYPWALGQPRRDVDISNGRSCGGKINNKANIAFGKGTWEEISAALSNRGTRNTSKVPLKAARSEDTKSRELSGLQFGRLFEEKVTSHLPISSVFKKGLNEVSESPLSVPSSAKAVSNEFGFGYFRDELDLP